MNKNNNYLVHFKKKKLKNIMSFSSYSFFPMILFKISAKYFQGLTSTSTAIETRTWLSRHRFAAHLTTFANFCGADLLRLSREDLIQICSLADGIRLYNALRAELVLLIYYNKIIKQSLDEY